MAHLYRNSALALALARVMRRRGVRVAPRPVKPLPITPAEHQMRSDILSLLGGVNEALRERLRPQLPHLARAAGVKLDAWPDDIRELFDGLREILREPVRESSRRIGGRAFNETNMINLRSTRAQIRSVIQVDVLAASPKLETIAAAFIEENVGLISSIPARYLDQVEALTLRGFRAGRRPEEIEEEIEEQFGVSESRAKLIARDQVSKLNGDLTRDRQTSLGIEEYVWRTSDDERVRASHKSKEGKTFRWDRPPADTGHPGEDVQCRCWPDPILDHLLD